MSNDSSGPPSLRVAWSDEPDALCKTCRDLRRFIRGTRFYQSAGDQQMRKECQMCLVIESCVSAAQTRFVYGGKRSINGRIVSVNDLHGLVVTWLSNTEPSMMLCFKLHDVTGGLGFSSGLFEEGTVASYAGDSRSLNFLRDNLVECLNGHPECQDVDDEDGFMPTRLLEIRPGGSSVHLVNTDSLCTRELYVALSHCWGNSPTLRTTRSNLDSHLSSIPIESLPANFHDAIKLCQAMLINYLWIDSLCIVQDDLIEWAKESQVMDTVYSRAVFTITAAAAASSAGGFLGRKARWRRSAPVLRIWLVRDHDEPHVVDFLQGDGDPSDLQEPLDVRAWTFQEQILSRRVMRLTTYQSKWYCTRNRINESGRRSPELFDPTHIRNHELHCLMQKKPEQIWRNYIDLLIEYGRRNITKSADQLPAIAGCMARFARVTGWKYYAGLWSYNLHLNLAWARQTTGKGFALAKCNECPPSWSWASLQGPTHFSWGSVPGLVVYTSVPLWGFDSCQSSFSILDIKSELATANLFGTVRLGAHIRMKALLADVTVICKQAVKEKKDRFSYEYSIIADSDDRSIPPTSFVADCMLKTTALMISEGDAPFSVETLNVRRASTEQTDLTQQVGVLGPARCMLLYVDENHQHLHAAEALVLGRTFVSANAYERLGIARWLRRAQEGNDRDGEYPWKPLFNNA